MLEGRFYKSTSESKAKPSLLEYCRGARRKTKSSLLRPFRVATETKSDAVYKDKIFCGLDTSSARLAKGKNFYGIDTSIARLDELDGYDRPYRSS